MLASEAFSPTTSGELPTAEGDVYWALADNLGSVRDIVAYDSGTGQTSVVNHIEYDAFGNITGETAAAGMDYALERYLYSYTGREWDADAELYAYRARWYDPIVGRFVSEDPIGFAAGDTNISRYVGNGVTNGTDPSGLKKGKSQNGSLASIVHDLKTNHARQRYWLIVFSDNADPAPGNAIKLVGHTWIGVVDTKTANSELARGFRPDGAVSGNNVECKGKIVDEANTKFVVARAYPISLKEYTALRADLQASPGTYHLADNNCTDWTVNVAQSAPRLSSYISIGKETRSFGAVRIPGKLGYQILTTGPTGSVLYKND